MPAKRPLDLLGAVGATKRVKQPMTVEQKLDRSLDRRLKHIDDSLFDDDVLCDGEFSCRSMLRLVITQSSSDESRPVQKHIVCKIIMG